MVEGRCNGVASLIQGLSIFFFISAFLKKLSYSDISFFLYDCMTSWSVMKLPKIYVTVPLSNCQ